MQRSRRKFLEDMRDRALRARRIAENRELAEIEADDILRSAIERELSIVGEALLQLHRLDAPTAERIERWKDIIGFRHILVHGYDDLDLEIIWDVVQVDLPKLIVQVDALLEEIP